MRIGFGEMRVVPLPFVKYRLRSEVLSRSVAFVRASRSNSTIIQCLFVVYEPGDASEENKEILVNKVDAPGKIVSEPSYKVSNRDDHHRLAIVALERRIGAMDNAPRVPKSVGQHQ